MLKISVESKRSVAISIIGLVVISFLLSTITYAQEAITFDLTGSELLRECPRTDCKIIQYGTIDGSATVKEISGAWYKVEVEEKATIQTLNDAPYTKTIKLAKPIYTEGYYYQSVLPQEVIEGAKKAFAETDSNAITERINASTTTKQDETTSEDTVVVAPMEQGYAFNVSLKDLSLIVLALCSIGFFLLVRRNIVLKTILSKKISPRVVSIASLVIIATFATYFGFLKYQEKQLSYEVSIKTQQEALERYQKEVEDLKENNEKEESGKEEDLKQLQEQIKSLEERDVQKAPIIISNPPKSENQEAITQSQPTDSVALIKKIAPAVVKLTCSLNEDNNDASLGSGTLFFNPDDETYTVFTNYHVIKTEDGSAPFCIVTVYPNSPSMAGALAYKSEGGSFTSFGGLDISAFRIEAIDDSIGQELFDQQVSKTLGYLKQYALGGRSTLLCDSAQIGEKVLILGYPSVGGESLTVTDGIVAGVENDGSTKYYKTSAKVEHGNSGGAAILENGCFLGIPTLAVPGSVESIAYILPLQ